MRGDSGGSGCGEWSQSLADLLRIWPRSEEKLQLAMFQRLPEGLRAGRCGKGRVDPLYGLTRDPPSSGGSKVSTAPGLQTAILDNSQLWSMPSLLHHLPMTRTFGD